MKKSQVTPEWIRKKYNVEDERQQIQQGNSFQLLLSQEIENQIKYPKTHKLSIDEFCMYVKKALLRYRDQHAVRTLVRAEECWGHERIVVENIFTRPETDQEVVERLSNEEKKKIDNETNRQNYQDKEYQLYLKLKQKYENQ